MIVLLVDQHEAFRMYGIKLQVQGYAVTSTDRADTALDILARLGDQYDAIVIGPQIGGKEAGTPLTRTAVTRATEKVSPTALAEEISAKYPGKPVIVLDTEKVASEAAFRQHTEGALPVYPSIIEDTFPALVLALKKLEGGTQNQ